MKKDSYSKSFLTLTMMVIYLMITVTNIFFLPRTGQLTDSPASGNTSIIKRNIKAAMSADAALFLVKRPDKSVAPSHKSLIDEVVRAALGSYILLFFVPFILKLNLNRFRLPRLLNGNFLPAHLSFCTFRI